MRSPITRVLPLLGAAVLLAPLSRGQGAPTGTVALTRPHPPLVPSAPLRVVTLGDFGNFASNPGPVGDVASLIADLAPDLVITLGDNNYPDGEAATIDANIGQFYGDFIHPYQGSFGAGADVNRFFPSLGNHDWNTGSIQPYLAYFQLPGNERYYDFVHGPVHFFALDLDPKEPDGISAGSVQGQWLQNALANSSSPFRVVFGHHPPFSSSTNHGSDPVLQWPFEAWGADACFSGHDHTYERIVKSGFPYFVNGLGGRSLYAFADGHHDPESKFRFNDDYGAQLLLIDEQKLVSKFITRGRIVHDMFTLPRTGIPELQEQLVASGANWKYEDSGTNLGTAWRAPAFDDSSWPSGPAKLGYGDADVVTQVDFGPNASNKHVTTYFRHTFQVDDPTDFESVLLELRRDDGAVAYLNGTEIWRSNLPSGTVQFGTLALEAIGGADENAFYGPSFSPELLVAGANTLAVEIHQESPTSSDLGFQLRLVGVRVERALVARGSDWSYRDDGVDLGEAWRLPAYDDSRWPTGPAQLGYGDGDEATVVSFGTNPNAKQPTTYFRHTFAAPEAERFDACLLRTLYDDGVVVYVNGHEVYRSNMPLTGVDYLSFAGLAVAGAEEDLFHETSIDPSVLVNGTNVVAVEVHNQNGTSSDISFDLELVGLQ